MSKAPRKLPRLHFKHVLTSFPEGLEAMFFEDYFKTSLPIVRVAIVLHIVLYALFGLLDIWIVPLHKQEVWLIRYAIICPLLVILLGLTFFKLFKNNMQRLLAGISYLSGTGIVIMIAIASESELGFKFYYAGLMLVIMWVYALARIRFIYATATSFLITISYGVIAIFVNRMLGTPENLTVFINNNFFFLSANIIGMFASFTIEWYMRKNYLLRMEIERAFELNQKYLDNIKEGLLLVDEDGRILSQHSLFVMGMFENWDLQGMSFVDLIYPDSNEFREERKELERFLHILFNNKSADMEMIMELNPFKKKKLEIQTGRLVSKEIIVNADFIRVYSRDTVQYVMVIFEDITGILKYEQEIEDQKTRYQQEVESISAILKSGPSLFADFVRESSQLLGEIQKEIEHLEDPRTMDQVFRKAHSLKGSARHLELNYIAAVSHKIEDLLARRRDNTGDAGEFHVQIGDLIGELFREFQNLNKIIDRIRVFSGANLGGGKNEVAGPLAEFLNSLPGMVESIAADLEKEAKLVIEKSVDEIPHLMDLKNPIIHMVRNSVDHGIEDQYERLSKKKGKTGRIYLRVYESGTGWVIEVEDDGRGLDFDRIREKGIEKGLIPPTGLEVTKSALLNLIFTPSFSSKDTVSEISGRGYGLDIVRDAALRLNGKISVMTKIDQGTKITLTVPK